MYENQLVQLAMNRSSELEWTGATGMSHNCSQQLCMGMDGSQT